MNNLKPSDKSTNSIESKRHKWYPVFSAAARVAVNNGRAI